VLKFKPVERGTKQVGENFIRRSQQQPKPEQKRNGNQQTAQHREPAFAPRRVLGFAFLRALNAFQNEGGRPDHAGWDQFEQFAEKLPQAELHPLTVQQADGRQQHTQPAGKDQRKGGGARVAQPREQGSQACEHHQRDALPRDSFTFSTREHSRAD